MPDAFLMKMRHRGVDGDPAALASTFVRHRTYAAGQILVAEGEESRSAAILSQGWVARYRILSNGRRQITSLVLPGDMLDLGNLAGRVQDPGAAALTACRVVTADVEAVRLRAARDEEILFLLWNETFFQSSIHREWLVSMGRRSAIGQLAHLICELNMRLAAVEESDGRNFRMPLTQSVLADVLGLSPVHVNRTLKELRRLDLLNFSDYRIEIRNLPKLAEIAEFSADYLGLHELDLPAPTPPQPLALPTPS